MAAALDEYVDYLRAAAIPEEFLPLYRTEAEKFLAAFEEVPFDALGATHVERYVEEAKQAGKSERTVRNLRVVAESLVAFLRHRASRIADRAPTRRPPAGPGVRDLRIPFIRDVRVAGMGVCRSSDLSVGGMFLETMSPVAPGAELELEFRLKPEDGSALKLRARVVYEHPSCGIGLVFLDVPDAVRARLLRFIDATAPTRA